MKINKILDNAYIFSVLAKIFSVFAGLAYTILLNRYLGVSLKGELAVVQNYISILSVILCLGIYQAYPYYKKNAISEAARKKVYIDFINFTLALFLIYLGISVICLLILDISWTAQLTIGLMSIAFMIKQFEFLVLIERSKIRNILNICLNIFDIFFVGLLYVCTDANYFYAALFLICQQSFYVLLACWGLRVSFKDIRPCFPKESIKYIKFGILPMLTTLMLTFNYKIDIIMLEKLEISSAQIGIYSVGTFLAEKIWLIPDTLKDILLSRLAAGKKADEVALVSRMSATITLACVFCMILLGKPFIYLCYGEEYMGAYKVMIVVLIGVLAMVYYKMIYSYNVINKKQIRNFIMLAVSAVINIILNLILIPPLGNMGAGVASLISYIICGALFIITFSIETKIAIYNLLFIKISDLKRVKKLLSK